MTLFAWAAGRQIPGTGQGLPVYKDVGCTPNGDAAASGPVANRNGGPAVDENIAGAFNSGLPIVRSVAFAGGGLAAHADISATFDDDAWRPGGRIGVLRERRRGQKQRTKCQS